MSLVFSDNPGMMRADYGTMRTALALSIGLHLVVFLPLPHAPNRVSMNRPLAARLQPARPAMAGESSAAPVVEPAPSKTLASQKTEPRAIPETEPRKDTGPVSSRQAASMKSPESPVTQPASSALEMNEGVVDGDAMRAYVLNVAVVVTRVVAGAPRDAGKIGRVRLRATIGPGLRGVEVLVSSGQAALDEEARALVARALAAALMPDALKGRVVRFDVPVSFGDEGRGGF